MTIIQKGEPMSDLTSRQAALDALYDWSEYSMTDAEAWHIKQVIGDIKSLPSAQPDDDRLERWKFEYVNACKILAHRTPDTRKKDIDDAYAVIKALHPIFGDVEF